ncbi:MAG: S-layer glycoprotein N-glycosyltransferase AglJ [Archaeoglobaceae archaeon]|nr:S-layer glycoprotein N-glycosyltransferase AglJ [Archaeoglobaceae archaeon]MDW8118566.1 S-layer glycoprotein N-glycosyltransferase AglJ [Archaeoglobaceae archaeon]
MKTTIVVPTLNEEKGIGGVVADFKKLGFEVLVVDGGSKDRTREIAQQNGAKVILQTGKGKGNAVSDAFKLLDSDIVVLVDGDGSYPPEEVHKLLEPIENGTSDHVIGNRFHSYEKGAFTRLNLIGNKILNFFFRFAYGVNLNDILSGYRALRREVYKNIEIKKSGFEVEVELTVETLAKGFRISEVPISYRKREGETKLKPIRDGFRIGRSIYGMLKRYSPARYIYLLGAIFVFLGLITGSYVVYGWLKGVTHILLAILTTMFILMGVQFFVFGLITHLLFRSTMELRKEINELRKKT